MRGSPGIARRAQRPDQRCLPGARTGDRIHARPGDRRRHYASGSNGPGEALGDGDAVETRAWPRDDELDGVGSLDDLPLADG